MKNSEGEETSYWFVFYQDQLLVYTDETDNTLQARIPRDNRPPVPVPVGSTIHTIGELDDV